MVVRCGEQCLVAGGASGECGVVVRWSGSGGVR